MPDITMCEAKFCPQAKFCYRKTAKPDRWQSYSHLEQFCNAGTNYPYFIRSKEIESNQEKRN